MTRTERRRAMRAAGYRRADTRKGRRSGIRPQITTDGPDLRPTVQPGLSQTPSGLFVARPQIVRPARP